MHWDYTKLAKHYDKRPDYSSAALKTLFDDIDLGAAWLVVDMGAGTGKLTRQLSNTGCEIAAVEPNTAMRRIGMNNIQEQNCRWLDTVAEQTGLPSASFDLVIFGSSFNVVDQGKALQESARLLRPGGWFACLWNHRDLTDALQQAAEEIILSCLPDYDYGTRRQDQVQVIDDSGFFGEVQKIEARFLRELDALTYVDAWRSHATLARQSGDLFPKIIGAIEELVSGLNMIEVPYQTRIWYVRKS